MIDPADPQVGVGARVGDRYRLTETIGHGAMGTVWRAADELLGRDVAVKQILRTAGATEEHAAQQRDRALREGRIAARLNNRHAVAVYDVAMEAGEPWLVMEHLPSTDLGTVVGAGLVLPVTQVAQIGAQVADALTDAHAAGILHRDVTPSNVLLGQGGVNDGIVKITDFGIARARGFGGPTEAGTITGTPAYFAPEVARGEPATVASDVYSLGATLFACLEGAPPFGVEANPYAMVHRIADGVMDPLTRAGAAEPVLARMLAVDPAARPSMAEVRDELAEVAAGRGGRTRDVLAARTDLVPLTRVAAGLGGAVAVGAALGVVAGGGAGGPAVTGGAAALGGAGSAAAADGAGSAVAGAGSAPSTTAAGVLTTSTAAKVGGMGALLSKPFLVALGVGAVVLAGGGAAVVLTGSPPSTPAAVSTGAAPPATTTSAPIAAADAERAVRELLDRLPTDPAGALATAGPLLHGVGPATVTAYFARGTTLQVGTVTAQDGGTVTAELIITLRNGTTTTQQVTLTVTGPAVPPAAGTPGPGTPTGLPPATTTAAGPSRTTAGASSSAAAAPLVVDSAQLADLLRAGAPTPPAPASTTGTGRPTPTSAPSGAPPVTGPASRTTTSTVPTTSTSPTTVP